MKRLQIHWIKSNRGGWYAPALLFSICASCVAAAATTSPWVTRVWQSDDGLPNNNVTSVAQTGDGYLWVANETRLAQFDGLHFESYPTRQIFPDGRDERIRVLLRSHDGSLWLALDHGPVISLKPGKEQIFTNGLPDLAPQCLAEDADGGIWIGYALGTLRCIKGGNVIHFTTQEGWQATNTSGATVTSDDKGRIWSVNNGQFGTFQNGKFQPVLILPQKMTRLAASRDGGVWICCGNELSKYDGQGHRQVFGTFNEQTSRTDPTMLLEDRNGAVWIGTSDSGLFRFQGSAFQTIPTSHPQILCLAEDFEGNIWAGTGGGGLDRVQPRPVMLEGKDAGLPFDAVQSMSEDTSGGIWAVTQNGLLAYRTNGAWTDVSGWPPTGLTCVVADRDGAIWLGTTHLTLCRWRDGQLETWNHDRGMDCHNIKSLMVTHDGDLWIAGFSPETLQRFRAGKFDTFKLPPDTGIIRAMAEDSAGNVWMGSSKHVLLRIKGDAITDEATNLPVPPSSIRALNVTPDGSLWIGYAGNGLGRIKNGKFFRANSAHGLGDDFISQIVSDSQGWLWIGSDHGIFKVRQQDFEALATGAPGQLRSVRFGQSAGLSSIQGNFGNSPGGFRSRDGRIWLPLRSGVAISDPTSLAANAKPPPVLLTQVTVDGQMVAQYSGVVPVRQGADLQNSQANLQLSPRHHRVEFEFTALSLAAPENIRFRYHLEGYDDGWIDAKVERNAAYSRLPAGDYRFQVKACNSEGVWSDTGAAVAFVVTPFFWQTWWFRVGTPAALALLVVAVTRFIAARRVKKKLEVLEQESALEKSRVAGMAEVATSVLHNVGNVLNSINVSNTLIGDKLRKSKVTNLSKIAALLQEHASDLPGFFANDPKGKQLPGYLSALSDHLIAERDDVLNEFKSLANDIDHIKHIVVSQQSYARASGMPEKLNLTEIVEDAIRIHAGAMEQRRVKIIREFQEIPPVTIDKHKVLQILINLISNAKYALTNGEEPDKKLIVRMQMNGGDRVKVSVTDNGMGITSENLQKIFQYGFTTRKEGHGFGLHSGALAAREMGGSLTVASEGVNRGATFTLEIPSQPVKK